MARVLMHVSAYYEGETHEPDAEILCDPGFARRVVLMGHGDLIVDGAPVDFAAACEILRAAPEDIAAFASIRAAALAEREG